MRPLSRLPIKSTRVPARPDPVSIFLEGRGQKPARTHTHRAPSPSWNPETEIAKPSAERKFVFWRTVAASFLSFWKIATLRCEISGIGVESIDLSGD